MNFLFLQKKKQYFVRNIETKVIKYEYFSYSSDILII